MCLRIYLIFNKFSQSSFQLSVKKDPRLLQFCFISLCDWSRKLAPLSKPVKCRYEKPISSWSVAFSRASTRLIVFDFSLDRDDVDLFFLTGGCDYFGYVGRQSLITVLFHSMLYALESFSKKCETISQFSMIISQSQTCRPSFV